MLFLFLIGAVFASDLFEIRALNGSNNNLQNPLWGSTGQPIGRGKVGPPAYAPGTLRDPIIKVDMRKISNMIADDGNAHDIWGEYPASKRVSAAKVNLLDVFFGQMITHDLVSNDFNYSDVQPMDADLKNDPFYKPGGPANPLNFTSLYFFPSYGTTVNNTFRTINSGNSFLDMSVVYGVNDIEGRNLRTGSGGRLVLSNYTIGGGNFNPSFQQTSFGLSELPPIASSVRVNGQGLGLLLPQNESLATGDARTSNNVGVLSLITVWMREHNRQAQRYSKLHPDWNDEQLYQAARRWTIAEYQAVAVYEYLPSILEKETSPYRGYDPSIDPSTSVEFATAAFRYAHSGSNTYDVLDGCTMGKYVQMFPTQGPLNTTLNPTQFPILGQPVWIEGAPQQLSPRQLIAYARGIENILLSIMHTSSAKIGTVYSSALRNGAPPRPLDLFAVDLYRGRQNGLPDYNTVRAAYGSRISCNGTVNGTDPMSCWSMVTSNSTLAASLQQLYGSVNHMDAIVGLLAEDTPSGQHLPPTMAAIIQNEFEKIRHSDRFWFENANASGLTAHEIAQLKSTRMKTVMEANTGLQNVPLNSFYIPGAKAPVKPITNTNCP